MAQRKWKVKNLREALADPRLDDYEIVVCYSSKVRTYESRRKRDNNRTISI